MSVNDVQSPYEKLTRLHIEDEFQEHTLSQLRKFIIKAHENDDKVEREKLLIPLRAECVNIHNARIAIAVARQRALKEIAAKEASMKQFWLMSERKQEYHRDYQNIWT